MNKKLGEVENPIKCYQPSGEIKYLDQLAGPHGERIMYKRIGSKKSPIDKKILDIYQLTSPDFQFNCVIHMDMYVKGYHEKMPIMGLRKKESFKSTEPWQSIKYFEERIKKIYGNNELEFEDKFIYLWTKAGILLASGPYIYAENDFFKLPKLKWNIEIIMRETFGLIHDLKGSSTKHPLIFNTRLELNEFMATFHFVPVNAAKLYPDCRYQFKHKISSEPIDMYALIANP
jgi:hypothetical protein